MSAELVTALPIRYLPLSAAARSYGVSIGTLRTMIEDGKLTAYRPTRGRKGMLLAVADLERVFAASAEPRGA